VTKYYYEDYNHDPTTVREYYDEEHTKGVDIICNTKTIEEECGNSRLTYVGGFEK
jgi:hypothetical protein